MGFVTQLRAAHDLLRRRHHLVRYTTQLKAHASNLKAQYTPKAQYTHSISNGEPREPKSKAVKTSAHFLRARMSLRLTAVELI